MYGLDMSLAVWEMLVRGYVYVTDEEWSGNSCRVPEIIAKGIQFRTANKVLEP